MKDLLDIQTILRRARVVAIIGCSDNRFRASNQAASMLVERGYQVIPINPKYESVLGMRCYADFTDVPVDVGIDIVNVFRRPEEAAQTVTTIVNCTLDTNRHPTVWTQPGVSTDQARDIAEEADLPYVQDTCIMTVLEQLA